MLKEKTNVPLYVQVARTLKEEIVAGVYPVGTLLPTEEALCERFSVSRYTVREALRILRDDGLVASRRGAGTSVIPPQSSRSGMRQVMSINDLLEFAAATKFEVSSIRMVTVNNKLHARTGLQVGSEWLEILGYRMKENSATPFCLAEYFVNRDYASVGRLLQRHEGPIFPLIEDMFGIKVREVQQEISATILQPTLADKLGVATASAALEVQRSYIGSDNSIAQVTINTHPGSRFKHCMTMRQVESWI
ncbi:GntR family transcriptional regulator [Halioxenophilus aromaticivorans]|uniref:GntR family transcriptional regulator n=1 Tax=Halioxenophilus aromaticivorans TaxID=1306992 RepID=A0AAV3TW69_9ALTE